MTVNQYIHFALELWGAIFCAIGVICIYLTRHYDKKAAWNLCALLITEGVLNVAEALAYFYRGNVSSTGYVVVRVANFVVFLCGYFLVLFVCRYLNAVLVRQGCVTPNWWKRSVYILCGIGSLLLVLSQMFGFYYGFDEQNRYYRHPETYWIMIILGAVPMIPLYIQIIKNRKAFKTIQYVSFLIFIILPVGGYLFQIFFYGASIYNVMNSICLIFFVVAYEAEYAAYMVEQERKLAEERLHLYHSQIQPHFIFNSITTIFSYLPRESKAGEVLTHFTKFLRGSIDLLAETECIPAERELETVEHYLYMEKERFGDDVKIDWNIRDRDFKLPTFTVQALVENAIRHGIRKTQDGKGTLKICTYCTGAEHIIEVEDDGVGFSPDVATDDRAHIGLTNVRNRLEMMCGGTLEIESEPGKGTRVKVRIPVER